MCYGYITLFRFITRCWNSICKLIKLSEHIAIIKLVEKILSVVQLSLFFLIPRFACWRRMQQLSKNRKVTPWLLFFYSLRNQKLRSKLSIIVVRSSLQSNEYVHFKSSMSHATLYFSHKKTIPQEVVTSNFSKHRESPCLLTRAISVSS